MKKLLILNSLTMLMGLSNINEIPLQVDAASTSDLILTYESKYETLTTIDEILIEDGTTPDPGTGVYTNMGYRSTLINIFNDGTESENITKQLFPYQEYVKSGTNGLDYLEVTNSEGVTSYNTFYYDYYKENLHIAPTPNYDYMEFTIDITGHAYRLESVIETYASKINQTTLFEIPLVRIDNKTVCGYLVDTSNQNDVNVYLYSNEGNLTINESYGYHFLTFTMNYQPEIYDISILNSKSFTSLDSLNAFSYASQSYTQFIPADWMQESVQPFLFEILDVDFENSRITFGHSTHTYDNHSFKTDFTKYRPTYMETTLYSATISDTGAVGNYQEGTSYRFGLSIYQESDEKMVMEIEDVGAGSFFSLLSDAGQIKITKVDYYIGTDDGYDGTTYSHVYDNENSTCNLFRYAIIETSRNYYIDLTQFLSEASTFKTLYSEYYPNSLNAPVYSENKNYLGAIIEPETRMSNTYFAQSFGFNLSFDQFNYTVIPNVDTITLTCDRDLTDSSNEEISNGAGGIYEIKENGYGDWFDIDVPLMIVDYTEESDLPDSLVGYNSYDGNAFDYLLMNVYQPDDTNRIQQYKYLKVKYTAPAYYCTRVNSQSSFIDVNDYVIGSSDTTDPLYGVVEEEPTDDPSNNQGNDSSNPSVDDNTSDIPEDEDNDNKPSIKDFFNKEDLTDNLKSILPIGLGVIGIIAVLALIFKKKK